MLAIRDIMTTDVVTVSPDLSLRDAMELFTSRHISGAPVVLHGRVVGVVSLNDLAEFAASTPGVPTERADFPDYEEDEPSETLPDEEPPGAYFAQLWEDSGADVVERLRSTSGPEWNVLEEHTVGEAMNPGMVALPASTPVEDAAELMQRAAVHRVIVMEGQKLVGVVTTKDISNAVAEQKLTRKVYVFDRRHGS